MRPLISIVNVYEPSLGRILCMMDLALHAPCIHAACSLQTRAHSARCQNHRPPAINPKGAQTCEQKGIFPWGGLVGVVPRAYFLLRKRFGAFAIRFHRLALFAAEDDGAMLARPTHRSLLAGFEGMSLCDNGAEAMLPCVT